MAKRIENRFERHSKIILTVLWIFVFVAGVAALEWALSPGNGRHTGTADQSSPAPQRFLAMREWERNSDYRMAPPRSRHRDTAGKIPKHYDLFTDENGFIEPAFRHKAADVDIVFLGGSTTECMYVNPTSRFPYRTARVLEQALGLKVNGVNAARSGNTAMHSLFLFLGKVAPRQPDFVVLMHGVNDIAMLAKHGSYWGDDKSRALVVEKGGTVDDGLRAVTNQLVPYSSRALLRARKSIKGLFAEAQAKGADLGSSKDQWRRHGEAFESALKSFIAAARAWKIEPVLMTQVVMRPNSEQVLDADLITDANLARAGLDVTRFNSIHDYFNAITRRLAATQGVTLVDLARARKWEPGIDLYDTMHFTDAGSERVAQLVAKTLTKRIEAERSEPGRPSLTD